MTEIIPFDQYPLPFNREEIIEMQEEALDGDQPFLKDKEDIIQTVDGFHEKYIEELDRTDEWSVFQCHWQGHHGWMYFWNYQLGYGFKVDDSWEVLCPLVEMMDSFTDEYDASDFEPAHYAWELP